MRFIRSICLWGIIGGFSLSLYAVTDFDSRVHDIKSQPIAQVPVSQKFVRSQVFKDKFEAYPDINTLYQAEVLRDIKSNAARVIKIFNDSIAKEAVEVTQQDLLEKAYEFISNNYQTLQVEIEDLSLNQDSVLIAEDIQSLAFKVKSNGLQIDDASLIFHYKKGEVVQVLNHSYKEAKVNREPKNFSDSDLSDFVRSVLLAQRAVKVRELYRVEESSDSYELVHVMEFDARVAGTPFLVQVDVTNKRIFEVVSTHIAAKGRAVATLYNRYYKEELDQFALPQLEIAPGVYTDENGEFELNQAPGKVTMKGKYVDVYDKYKRPLALDLHTDNAAYDWELAFERDPSNKDSKELHRDRVTAQAMVYYHTSLIASLAKSYIPETKWLDKPLKANANVKGLFWLGSCNAYWNGEDINFYKGSGKCANTGLIADVIYHEWGHGLDHNTGGIADRAFSEGFGDIMSIIITGSSKLGIGFFQKTNEPVRELEPDKIYPKDKGGFSPHAEGQIIGSTFWDLFKDLKAKHGEEQAFEIARNYGFKMIYLADRYTQVYDALLAIDDNDGDLSNGTPNFCLINKNFSDHGLATPDASCN